MKAPSRSQQDRVYDGEVETTRSLGEALRAVRKDRGHSLAEVAEGTGISRSFLSLVEMGRSDISIGRLMRLVTFYGVGLSDIVRVESDSGNNMVVRRKNQKRVHSAAEDIEVFLLVSDTKRQMMPVLVTLGPYAGPDSHIHHEGEEFVHVLEGRILLELESEDPMVLEQGDSVYYSSERGHALRNLDGTPARLIAVATPPHI